MPVSLDDVADDEATDRFLEQRDIDVICAECHNEFAISEKDLAKLDPSEYLCPTCVKEIDHEEDVAARFEANYGQQDFQED